MELLSKYRRELFGLGALGVIAVHGSEPFRLYPLIYKIMGYGGASVYVFALLSGMGLWFSITNTSDDSRKYSKVNFYRQRIVRLLLPYLLISGVWYAIRYLFFERDVLTFLYNLSTVSFWREHLGAWYVAMLLPVYAVFPFYHDWVERGGTGG